MAQLERLSYISCAMYREFNEATDRILVLNAHLQWK